MLYYFLWRWPNINIRSMFRICWTETVTLIVKSSTQKFTTDYFKHLVGSMVGIRLQDWPSPGLV